MRDLPSRVVFTFLARCNMRCPFCYCEFDGRDSTLSLWSRVTRKLLEWELEAITFSGGDPFSYRGFTTLLKELQVARGTMKLVQVDTNGLAVSPHELGSLSAYVDLFGFPLDASTESANDQLRLQPGHFRRVIALLEACETLGLRPKVNTVVTAQNIVDIPNLMRLLSTFHLAGWALYEFWPLGAAALPKGQAYCISREAYSNLIGEIRRECDFTAIEVGSLDARRGSHLLVNERGDLYCIGHNDRYEGLGSVFDEGILAKCSGHYDATRMHERTRDRLELLSR